ncbi:MAG: GNAT family N-acetyltransferase [Magnetococcales bacterium]|nr:GNAT family N-acetyltransferase [Magnetococcales bacterium]
MIRDAEERDIPQILNMMEMFYHESGYSVIGPIDDQSLTRLLQALILEDRGILFVLSEHGAIIGFIGGALVPFFANNQIVVCQEMFWFVRPESRGNGSHLLARFEERARQLGADIISTASVEKINPSTMHRLYTMKGFSMMEHGFVKRLR